MSRATKYLGLERVANCLERWLTKGFPKTIRGGTGRDVLLVRPGPLARTGKRPPGTLRRSHCRLPLRPTFNLVQQCPRRLVVSVSLASPVQSGGDNRSN